MRSRAHSINSITELFRPNNRRRLGSRSLSYTRLSLLKNEIQTDAHIIPLSKHIIHN